MPRGEIQPAPAQQSFWDGGVEVELVEVEEENLKFRCRKNKMSSDESRRDNQVVWLWFRIKAK